MKIRSWFIVLLLLFAGCSNHSERTIPTKVELYAIEEPSHIKEVIDDKDIQRLVSIFDEDDQDYLVEESSIDSLGLVMVTFIIENREETFDVHGLSNISHHYYYTTGEDNRAFSMTEEDYAFLFELLN